MILGVNGGLKQRKEDVLQHLGKIRDQLFGFENITEKDKKVATDHEGGLKEVLLERWCWEVLLPVC